MAAGFGGHRTCGAAHDAACLNAGRTGYAGLRIHFHCVFGPSIQGIGHAWPWPLDGARHCMACRPVPLLLAHAGVTHVRAQHQRRPATAAFL